MIAVEELTTARILKLVRHEDDRLEWVEVGTVECPPNPAVAMSIWIDSLHPDEPPADYEAVLADGRRSDQVRWPDPFRPARSRALGAR